MRDNRSERENQTRHAAGMVLFLHVIRELKTLNIFGSTTYAFSLQNRIKNKTRVW